MLIAFGASCAGLIMAMTLAHKAFKHHIWLKISGALVIGIAICGMHYTGMAATVFIPFADCRYDPHQSFSALAVAVAIVSTSLFAVALTLGFNLDPNPAW